MRQTVFEETTDGITIDRVIRDYEYNMPSKHFHDEYEIYYILEGERFYFIGQRTYHIQKGCLVFVNKNLIHKTGMAQSSYHDRILIEFCGEPFGSFFSYFNDLSLENFFENNTGVIALDPQKQSFVENLLLEMQSEIHHKAPGYRLSVMMKLSTLLIFAMRYREKHLEAQEVSAESPKHKRVDEVANYIINHCNEQLSLESVAETFYVNKCYLSRIFKEVTSFTINEYINVHRINNAQMLLTDTDLSITEIALQCGYESLTYFEKVFKTYREISPLKYRNEYKRLHHKRTSKAED